MPRPRRRPPPQQPPQRRPEERLACSGVTRDALVAMSGVTRDELVAMSGVRRGAEVAKPQKRSNSAPASITRGPLRRRTRWACCFLAKHKLRQLGDVRRDLARFIATNKTRRAVLVAQNLGQW